MKDLNSQLLRTTREYFRTHAWNRKDLKYFKTALAVRQLRLLLEASDRIPADPAEVPGLPLDRFLLRFSPTYRRFRSLSAKMGIRFVPEFMSLSRALERFNPASEQISFCPADQELRWAAKSKLTPEGQSQIVGLVNSMTSAPLHETSHALLFRVLRPSRTKTTREIVNYLTLVESFVILCDFHVASELGIASYPISKVGLPTETSGSGTRTIWT